VVTKAALVVALSMTVPAMRVPAHAAEPMQVVLIKRAGVTAYEEVAEEFAERCRVHARVLSFGDEGPRGLPLGPDVLLVTVGQEAIDAVAAHSAIGARIIPILAFHPPDALVGPPASPSPELILKVLAVARAPKLKVVGAVYGPRSAATLQQAAAAAHKLGLTLMASRVSSGAEAVRALRRLGPDVGALWLPGDPDVITPQVFQYALRLQLELGLPVAAATRQQVHSGALVAVDFSPRAAGRVAADLANRYLEGRTLPADVEKVDLYGGARVTVNATVARRLGVDVVALERMGARVE
jgi:hypothetical protein